MTPQYLNDVQEVLRDFMHRMKITYPKVTYDSEFAQSCNELALSDGFLPDVVESPEFQLALHGAVAIATTTYAHLENNSTRQYICLYTTWSAPVPTNRSSAFDHINT